MCIILLPAEGYVEALPLEVLCLWEGWLGDKVHESEDLQRSFKMLRGKLQVWVSMLGIYSPKEDVRSF